MVGLNKLAKGWDRVAVMICDATAEPELLRAIWPQLRGETWPPITRSNNVEIYQVVDKSVGKWAIAVEAGEKEKEQARAARRMYAALLTRALQYREAIAAALQDNAPAVAAITYKLTEEWIRKNCCVPKWLKLAHFGDVTGTNEFSDVAALFEIGRPLPPSEAVTRQAEALFGGYIGERDYVGNKGHILIKPLEAGYDAVEVDVWRHPNPNAERLRRMICQGSLIQAEGRARAALRGVTGKSLEIHRWTDVPLPELGPDSIAMGRSRHRPRRRDAGDWRCVGGELC
jgi:hypothetical protein